MPWAVVGAVVGGAIQADTASRNRKAANGASASNDALAQQQFEEDKRRYDLNREDQERWGMMTIQGEEEFDRRNRADKERAYQRGYDLNKGNIDRGELAGNQLAFRMGLGPKRGGKAAVAATGATGGTFDAAQYLADNPDIRAYDWAVADPEHHYKYYGQAEGRARPVVAGTGTAGTAATAAVEGTDEENIGYGGLNERFKDFNFNFEADPGYQFQREEGLRGVGNQFAQSGNLLSGAALKAMQRFGTGLADQSYDRTYNRARSGYESDRQYYEGANLNEYNRLAGLQGAGQNAINSTNGLGGTVQGSAGNGASGIANGLQNASNAFAASSNNYYNNVMSNNNARANSQSAYNNAFGNSLAGGLGSLSSNWNSYQNNSNNYSYPTSNFGGYDDQGF